MENISRPAVETQCEHCQTLTKFPLYDLKENAFCCNGCLSVFQILHDENLTDYYRLNENAHPVSLKNQTYQYLNDESFVENFIKKEEGIYKIKFYLEGVHCVACLWVVEKLPSILEGVITSRLNMATNINTIEYDPTVVSLSEIASKMASFGYPPHPIKENQSQIEFLKKEKKADLIKIGIAAAFSGNIMIYSYSLYSGASGEYETVFKWLTFLMCLPVVGFSATPFYQNAYSSLKNKIVSIDIPIVLAIFLAMITGIINLVRGEGEIYFDSIATLIFLLLSTRTVLKHAYKKGLSDKASKYFLNNTETKVFDGKKYVDRLSDFVKDGDKILVESNKFIPADGTIIEGEALIDQSLITGESLPVSINLNQEVIKGTLNLGNQFYMKATHIGDQSKLGQMINEIEDSWSKNSEIVKKSDLIAKYFLYSIFTLATILFLIKLNAANFEVAFSSALTLIIVSCPCALGLATPFALIRSLKIALKSGIVIKSESVFDKLLKSKNIFFDKTGTLTKGEFEVVKMSTLRETDLDLNSIIYSLEQKSQHPIGKAIKLHLGYKNLDIIKFDTLNEIPGSGIEATLNGDLFEVKSSNQINSIYSTISLSINSIPYLIVELGDTIREDSFKAIDDLKVDYNLAIISGDQPHIVKKVASELGIQTSYGKLTPQDKLKLVEDRDNTIVVGDGFNDALAMSKAPVSIAVSGSSLLSLKTSDVFLTKPGVYQIHVLLKLAKETRFLVNQNIFISLLYNFIVIIMCFLDFIGPLHAAIIMPVSSFTVFISTLIGTKYMRKI